VPQVFNINPPIAGLNLAVRSVRCWFWPSTEDHSAEVPIDQSHHVEYDAFPQNNANGVTLGRGSIDTGDATAMQRFNSTTVQELMTSVFG
jgi:hypothetical protein